MCANTVKYQNPYSIYEKIKGKYASTLDTSYVKDESSEHELYRLSPFDPTKSVKKLKAWGEGATPAEIKETQPMLDHIYDLLYASGKEVSGVQLIVHFLRVRVQPLQARISGMWTYTSKKDPMRVSRDKLTCAKLEKRVRSFTNLTKHYLVRMNAGLSHLARKTLYPIIMITWIPFPHLALKLARSLNLLLNPRRIQRLRLWETPRKMKKAPTPTLIALQSRASLPRTLIPSRL